MAHSLTYALWLTSQAWSFVVGFWAPGLILTVLLLVAAFLQRTARRRILLLTGLTPLVLPILILLVGAFLRSDGSYPPPRAPSLLLTALLFSHIPLCAVLTYRARGARWFSLAASGLAAWLSLAISFVAYMSVTGDWL